MATLKGKLRNDDFRNTFACLSEPRLGPSWTTPPVVWNTVAGSVDAIQHGLTRTSTRVQTRERLSLRVRWPYDSGWDASLKIGQEVVVSIAANDILLGAPGAWPGQNRWNRWEGRIVLVEPAETVFLITVKVRGVGVTLKSIVSTASWAFRPQVWDEVSIAVDPEKLKLTPRQGFAGSRRLNWTSTSSGIYAGSQVWLKGLLETVQKAPAGWLLSLEIGGAHVSALMDTKAGEKMAFAWTPGREVEILVGQWEAWVKPFKQDVEPISCSLLHRS